MNLRRSWICLPMLLLGGCSWIPYAARNVTGTPLTVVENTHFLLQAHRLARLAWQEVYAQHPDTKYSKAYVRGFKDGFCGFLKQDGTGDPPAVPPRLLRHPVLRTPEEQQAIEDWYAGYHHGAEVAHEQRWRELIVVPIELPPRIVPTGYKEEFVPYPPPPSEETAPMPKTLPPAEPEPLRPVATLPAPATRSEVVRPALSLDPSSLVTVQATAEPMLLPMPEIIRPDVSPDKASVTIVAPPPAPTPSPMPATANVPPRVDARKTPAAAPSAPRVAPVATAAPILVPASASVSAPRGESDWKSVESSSQKQESR
jgi:hypothetical protein